MGRVARRECISLSWVGCAQKLPKKVKRTRQDAHPAPGEAEYP
jgi:hypothetical protein